MTLLASAYAGVGLLSVVGGAIGYKKAQSVASLVAGGMAGAGLLGAAALAVAGNTTLAVCVGGGLSLLLAARFVPSYWKTHKLMPHGVMAVCSVLGFLISVREFMR